MAATSTSPHPSSQPPRRRRRAEGRRGMRELLADVDWWARAQAAAAARTGDRVTQRLTRLSELSLDAVSSLRGGWLTALRIGGIAALAVATGAAGFLLARGIGHASPIRIAAGIPRTISHTLVVTTGRAGQGQAVRRVTVTRVRDRVSVRTRTVVQQRVETRTVAQPVVHTHTVTRSVVHRVTVPRTVSVTQQVPTTVTATVPVTVTVPGGPPDHKKHHGHSHDQQPGP